MTTTNVYQGLGSAKNTSRVLQAPGGGSSNIFGHYQEESDRERAQKKQQETETVMQSAGRAGANGDFSNNFYDNKNSFDANRQRNQGEGAPFAVSDSLVNTAQNRPAVHHQAPPPGADYSTPREQHMANRNRNQGTGAPFATGDQQQPAMQSDRPAHHQQTIGADYQTPQQRQANNPNKAGNSFSNLFGDTEEADGGAGARGKPKVSTHNPVTWEAYSNFDQDQDHPQHRSRFENFASTKAGTFNPITGEDHSAGGPHTSTKVHAPPGGASSIQF